MRLANVEGRASIAAGQGWADVATASGGRFGPSLPAVYEEWDDFSSWAPTAMIARAAVEVDEHQLGAPSPAPRQVFGIGLNYRAHAQESGVAPPERPATFTKFPSCITGPFADVVLPAGGTTDWEVELVVVIGRVARTVTRDAGWSCVAGVTVGQDLSERGLQFAAGGQFSLGKSYPGFGPTGPWLVTADELADADDLELGCSIDGEVVQRARTGDLIFSVPALIEELSAVLPLLPGDLIFTGTPSGVGMARRPARFLAPGEAIESWVEGVGTMRTRIVGDPPVG